MQWELVVKWPYHDAIAEIKWNYREYHLQRTWQIHDRYFSKMCDTTFFRGHPLPEMTSQFAPIYIPFSPLLRDVIFQWALVKCLKIALVCFKWGLLIVQLLKDSLIKSEVLPVKVYENRDYPKIKQSVMKSRRPHAWEISVSTFA